MSSSSSPWKGMERRPASGFIRTKGGSENPGGERATIRTMKSWPVRASGAARVNITDRKIYTGGVTAGQGGGQCGSDWLAWMKHEAFTPTRVHLTLWRTRWCIADAE